MSESLMQESKPQASQGNIIRVGDTVVIRQAGASGLHWDTSGDIVTLSDHGNGKDVVLTVSAHPGGPSAPLGAPLKGGSYIRLVSPRHPAPNGDLIAFKSDPSIDKVRIGKFEQPDPNIDNVFFVAKVSGSLGDEIRRGDVVNIRGVSHDPWLRYAADATAGSPVLLGSDNQSSASSWVFGHGGDDGSE